MMLNELVCNMADECSLERLIADRLQSDALAVIINWC